MACMIPIGFVGPPMCTAAPLLMPPASCGWGNWKATSSHSIVMCTVRNRTVPLLKTMSFNFFSPLDNKVTRSSHSFVGSPIRNRTVSSAAASPPLLILPQSSEEDGGKTMCFNVFNPVDKKVTRLDKRRSSTNIEGEEEEELIRLESAVLVAGCSHGWLAMFKRKGPSDYDMFLYNPISGRTIKLPPLETIPPLPPVEDGEEEESEEEVELWKRAGKVILSCPPEEDQESCRAILLYGPRDNVAVCCPGLSTEWTPFGAFFHEDDGVSKSFGKARKVRSYDDFVYSTRRKQLFCVAGLMDLEAWDIGDPLCPKLIWKVNIDDDFEYDDNNYPWHARTVLDAFIKRKFSIDCTHLAFSEHSDRLFLVQTCLAVSNYSTLPDTVGFEVHEIIREEGGEGGELRFMDGTLDGMTLFVSDTHAFVVESPCTMGLLPNSIYCTEPNENGKGVRYLVIFDYEKESLYLSDPNENGMERACLFTI